MEGTKPNQQSRVMYDRYAAFVSFKTRFFAHFIRPTDKHVVELLSGPGANMDLLHHFTDLSAKKITCLDLDRSALDECHKKGYATLFCDVNNLRSQIADESIDVFLSNSFHHVPSTVEKVIKEQVMPCLKKGGRLVGVEGYSILAKIFMKLITWLPQSIIKKSLFLTEFYAERNEITKFLGLNFEQILRSVNASSVKIKKGFVYIFYVIEK